MERFQSTSVGRFINHCLNSTCSGLCMTAVCLSQSRKLYDNFMGRGMPLLGQLEHS